MLDSLHRLLYRVSVFERLGRFSVLVETQSGSKPKHIETLGVCRYAYSRSCAFAGSEKRARFLLGPLSPDPGGEAGFLNPWLRSSGLLSCGPADTIMGVRGSLPRAGRVCGSEIEGESMAESASQGSSRFKRVLLGFFVCLFVAGLTLFLRGWRFEVEVTTVDYSSAATLSLTEQAQLRSMLEKLPKLLVVSFLGGSSMTLGWEGDGEWVPPGVDWASCGADEWTRLRAEHHRLLLVRRDQIMARFGTRPLAPGPAAKEEASD